MRLRPSLATPDVPAASAARLHARAHARAHARGLALLQPLRTGPSSARACALGALLALPLASCHDGDGDCSHCEPPPPPPAPVYEEIEPNDSPYFPDRLGVVDRYTLLYVDGHVEAIGLDVVDHLEFHSATPATYDFRVDAWSAYGDVDVTVYDPLADVVVGVFAVSGPYELGRVVVHQPDRPFQLILEAYLHDTYWTVELAGGPYSGFGALTAGAGGAQGADESEADELTRFAQPGAGGSDDAAAASVSPIEVIFIRDSERL